MADQGLGVFYKQLLKYTGSLYVCRRVANADDIVAWAKSQGFVTAIDPADMHVTIAHSKAELKWPPPRSTNIILHAGSPGRSIERFDAGAVVLHFDSKLLASRHAELREQGASHDFPEYKPHVTISYNVPDDFDLTKVKPYDGEIVFGPEQLDTVKDKVEHVEKTFKLFKADKKKDLGLIFGWAIVSCEDCKPYYDTQGDHIPEESMLEAATDFMLNHRAMKVMHSGKKVGTVVFAWPMTEEIAEAMGIKSARTGLMVAVKPDSKRVLERFKDNEYTGFSIGGNRLIDEDVE
jgi:putative serine protease XkdF